jgi:uncharacterized protein YcbK (DUF882 family)
LAALSLPGIASAASLNKPLSRQLSIYNANTGERWSGEYWRADRWNGVFWEGATYHAEGLAGLNHVLRDHRDDEVFDIKPALYDALFELIHRTGHRGDVILHSGYRSKKTNDILKKYLTGVSRDSLHTQGVALDFKLDNQDLMQTFKAALDLKAGGVGYYPEKDFLHIDIGKVRYWWDHWDNQVVSLVNKAKGAS